MMERERTTADAETAIRNWLIYREAKPTEADLWLVLGELERLAARAYDTRRRNGHAE